MDWPVKGVVQKILSHAPGGFWINDRLQTSVGDLRNFDRTVDGKVTGDWIVLAGHFRELGMRIEGMDILEIGSGWFPTLPLCFHLAGVASCRTYDLTRHMNEGHTFRCLRRLEAHLAAIAAATETPLEAVRKRYRTLLGASGLGELLERARIFYSEPADATKTGLPGAALDMVYSNSVLEHVPEPVIAKMMAETLRILKPGGAPCTA